MLSTREVSRRCRRFGEISRVEFRCGCPTRTAPDPRRRLPPRPDRLVPRPGRISRAPTSDRHTSSPIMLQQTRSTASPERTRVAGQYPSLDALLPLQRRRHQGGAARLNISPAASTRSPRSVARYAASFLRRGTRCVQGSGQLRRRDSEFRVRRGGLSIQLASGLFVSLSAGRTKEHACAGTCGRSPSSLPRKHVSTSTARWISAHDLHRTQTQVPVADGEDVRSYPQEGTFGTAGTASRSR